MPKGLKRYQQNGDFHFITFSCYRRQPTLASPQAMFRFEQTLERVRDWYGLLVCGYVVMPEHVHILVSEPERGTLAIAIQMLKQITAKELQRAEGTSFWQVRYYDFNVLTDCKRIEKLRYMHRNPVERRLALRPEDWPWSSYLHYATGVEGTVAIASGWTAYKREGLRTGQPTLSPKDGDKGGAPNTRCS
jgi:putative transposase